jgi:hexosaminidase
MKKLTRYNNAIFFTLCLFFILSTSSTGAKIANNDENYIIPKPNSIIFTKGRFSINKNTTLIYDRTLENIAKYFTEQITSMTGFEINISDKYKGKNTVTLKIVSMSKETDDEFYKISVSSKSTIITAISKKGLFRGIQTFLQLFPLNVRKDTISIPCCEIEDTPAFSWRGLNLDCGRHFMTKDFVKRYIDILARYKFNKFHWHLTEDQGWRIEIKQYPKLTSVGAWRKEADGSIYGGFYTQDDIKEIVAYAKSRYIDIIPEIEMPGHSLASLASYPENSCSGGSFEVTNSWGIMKDIYCAGRDSTFIFLENILSEVTELFPYDYIHIGGDEAPRDRWKNCPKCQERIKTEGLKNESELQSYFIRRIANFLATKGKKIIGWEEILEGGLTEGATVQSWTGFKGAIKAANEKHNSICSPYSYTYLNSDPKDLDMKTCYSFLPTPKEISSASKKFIIGSEANLWTEFAPQETVDSKLFPRLLALSEVFWTDSKNKNYDEFYSRVQNHYRRLISQKIEYGREGKAISFLLNFNKQEKFFTANFIAEEKNIDLRFTLDGSKPNVNSTLYSKPIMIADNATLKMVGFKLNQPICEPINLVFSRHKALGAEVELKYPCSEKYPGNGKNSLTDGIHGTTDVREGNWQGFEGTDMEAVIDLGKEIEISKISLTCIQDASSWIFFPEKLDFYTSNDKVNFVKSSTIINDYPQKSSETIIKTFTGGFEKTKCRYIKVFAEGIKKCPAWHPGAGDKAWIFADEIVVE